MTRAGFLAFPLALALATTSGASIGTWLLLHRWRLNTATQLRLDRCTADTAISFRSAMQRIESRNDRISALRASIAAATLQPQLIPALRTALNLQASLQVAELTRWRVKSAAWMAGADCAQVADLRVPLPQLPWAGVPPDPIGPRPLLWSSPRPISTYSSNIRLGRPPRHSRAEVYRHVQQWKLHWVRPGLH